MDESPQVPWPAKNGTGRLLPPSEERCVRMAKATGERCRNPRYELRNECEWHSRNSRKAAKKNLITGRYSKVLGNLRNIYRDAINDPEILRLEPTLALQDVRISEMLSRIDEHDVPQFRQKAHALWKDYSESLEDTDPKRTKKLLADLGKTLEQGMDRDKAWEEVLEKAERRSVRTEKALALMIAGAQVVHGRDLMRVMGRIIDIVIEEAKPEAAHTILGRVTTEVMGELDGGESHEARREGDRAIRSLPQHANGVLPGGLGEGTVVEAVGDSGRAEHDDAG